MIFEENIPPCMFDNLATLHKYIFFLLNNCAQLIFSPGKPTTMQKFCETGWRWFYYSCVFTYGVICLWDKPWLWNIRYCWQVLGSDTAGRFQDQILLVGSRIRYCWQVLGSNTVGRFQDQILLVGFRIRYCWQVLGSDFAGRFQDQILLVGSRIRYCWQVLGYCWQVLGSDTAGRFQDTAGRFQDQILLADSRNSYCW